VEEGGTCLKKRKKSTNQSKRIVEAKKGRLARGGAGGGVGGGSGERGGGKTHISFNMSKLKTSN